MPDRIPIHVITGFLGSGKTTLIKNILAHEANSDTLVVVNELGEIGLDNLLVEQVHENTYLLSSGCICCTVLSDVKETLLKVLSDHNACKITPFKNIIIETTGLANPASMLNTLSFDTHLKSKFVVHGMTCVIDGTLAITQSTTHPEWLPQVIASNTWVLSKRDLISAEEERLIKSRVEGLGSNGAWIDHDKLVNTSNLFATEEARTEFHNIPFSSEGFKIHNETQSGVIVFDKLLDWTVFGLWLNILLKQYGESILRIKGMLYLKGQEKPVFLHGVQHCIYPPEHLLEPLWGDGLSRLLFICRGVDIEKIRNSAHTFMKIFKEKS